MKNLRDLKILMKNSLMSEEVAFEIAHAQKNFINIDLTDEESEESSVDEEESFRQYNSLS